MKDKMEFTLRTPFKSIFYILDKRDMVVIAIEKEVPNGYYGLSFKWEMGDQFDTSPYYIAKTYIENEKDRYDFTNNISDAIRHILV